MTEQEQLAYLATQFPLDRSDSSDSLESQDNSDIEYLESGYSRKRKAHPSPGSSSATSQDLHPSKAVTRDASSLIDEEFQDFGGSEDVRMLSIPEESRRTLETENDDEKILHFDDDHLLSKALLQVSKENEGKYSTDSEDMDQIRSDLYHSAQQTSGKIISKYWNQPTEPGIYFILFKLLYLLF
jgi:hypothetical protein